MRNQELHRSKFLFLNCFFTQWSSWDTEVLKFRSLPDAVFICIREISKDAKSAEGQPLFLISKHTVPFNSFCFFSTSSMFLFLFYFLSFSLSFFSLFSLFFLIVSFFFHLFNIWDEIFLNLISVSLWCNHYDGRGYVMIFGVLRWLVWDKGVGCAMFLSKKTLNVWRLLLIILSSFLTSKHINSYLLDAFFTVSNCSRVDLIIGVM